MLWLLMKKGNLVDQSVPIMYISFNPAFVKHQGQHLKTCKSLKHEHKSFNNLEMWEYACYSNTVGTRFKKVNI